MIITDVKIPEVTPEATSTLPIIPPILDSKDDMIKRIKSLSSEYRISEDLFLYIIEHESSFDEKAIGDTKITCRTGINASRSVYARGLAQITRCYHPEISDEQAFDPEFSLVWAAKIIQDKKSCLKEFSTCKEYYTK